MRGKSNALGEGAHAGATTDRPSFYTPNAIKGLFPTLRTHYTRAGQRYLEDSRMVRHLIANGAPADLHFHTLRHTLATYLENAGHSEWERGLILNHSSSSVTAGYSHGYPLQLKLALLTKWADHVEALVQPRARVLR